MKQEERDRLRKLAEYGTNSALQTIRNAVPRIVDALDAADARIAELETKLASFKPWPPPGVDFAQALAERLCSRCGERERDDPFYCAECSARLALEHEVDVHKARIAELEKLLATEASERETALAAEVARLKAIFDDAGQGEANVLAVIDDYQDQILELQKRVEELSAAEEEPALDEESLSGLGWFAVTP